MSGKYRTIVADPPWPLPSRVMGSGGRRRRSTEVPYAFMTLDAIKALPVESLAADDALLWLWCTRRDFREGSAAAVAHTLLAVDPEIQALFETHGMLAVLRRATEIAVELRERGVVPTRRIRP